MLKFISSTGNTISRYIKGVNFGSFILSDRVYESADPSVKVKVKK